MRQPDGSTLTSETPKTLFAWRGRQGLSKDFMSQRVCVFCSIPLVLAAYEDREAVIVTPSSLAGLLGAELAANYEDDEDESGGFESRTYEVCPLCGWILVVWESGLFGVFGCGCYGSALREFNINDREVSLAELGTHLKGAFSDIYTLSWERFEDLVADVFKRNHGGQVIQTLRSADGGADVILLSHDGTSIDTVVECKRFAQHRKVGVDLIRQMVGVCVDWQTAHAIIVTSSGFTSNAVDLTARFRSHGFTIDLIGANELLLLLKSYNQELPPLTKLSIGDRQDLILQNRAAIADSILIPDSASGTSHGWTFRKRVTRFR